MYCAPCKWQMELALGICDMFYGLRPSIRVDARLANACSMSDANTRARKFETKLMSIEDEMTSKKDYSLHWLTDCFDLQWLERCNLLRATGELDPNPAFQTYLDEIAEEEQVSAVLVLSSVQDIQALAERHSMAKAAFIQNAIVYRLDFSADICCANVFTRVG